MGVTARIAGADRHRFGPNPSRHATPSGRRRFSLAFPGARLASIGEAPRRCPTCGGPWRRLEASLACLTCPTELYIAAELRRVQTGCIE
jgi:hypothetical protein